MVLSACVHVFPAVATDEAITGQGFERRFVCAADIDNQRTAIGEDAAAGQLLEAGRIAADRLQAHSMFAIARLGHTANQPEGVGMMRRFEKLVNFGFFHDLAGVQDEHALAELGDDPEVVRDIDDAGIAVVR